MTTLKHSILVMAFVLFGSGKMLMADPIVFEVSAVASGQLNGVNFDQSELVITGYANSDETFNIGYGIGVFNTQTSVYVDGVGTDNLTGLIQSFNNFSAFGFGDIDTDLAIAFVTNQGFADWDLTTSIGPLSGETLFNPGAKFQTVNGSFRLDDIGIATLTATTIPEPATASIFVFLSLSSLLRRRRDRCDW